MTEQNSGCSTVTEVVKRTRKGTPKTKFGCLTCRIRHLRCDEGKPACVRCTSTGRTCDFLQPPTDGKRYKVPLSKPFQRTKRSTSRQPNDAKKALVSRSRAVALLPKLSLQLPSPSPSPFPMNSFEATHFDYFRLVCLNDFSGYFNDSLWDTLIPQASHSEPSLKHAAIAFGAWHRCQSDNTSDKQQIKQLSILKYTEAIKTINDHMDSPSVSPELTILASFLFMAYETLTGNDSGALTHFEGAYSVLQGLRQKQIGSQQVSTSSPSRQSPSLIEIMNLPGSLDKLTESMTRLSIQASSFAKPYVTKPHPLPALPNFFTNLSSARNTLDAIIASKEYALGLDITPELPSSLTASMAHISQLLDTWSALFNDLLSTAKTPYPRPPVAVLQIQHITATINLSTAFTTSQLLFDGFHTSFRKVVELAEGVIEPAEGSFESDHATSGKQRFSFDIGIVQPLYFVALKCRDGILRRRAQRVMRSAGTEGVYDGKAMAAVAEWVMKTEEEGTDGMEFVAEELRLHNVDIIFDRAGRKVKTIATRLGRELGSEWEYLRGVVEY